MHRTPLEWEEKLQDMGALWYHDGNPARPHPLLTSGKHSSGFCNCEILMENPQLLSEACADLLERAKLVWKIDRVVGPAMGAITIAHEIGRLLGTKRAYVEKNLDDASVMLFSRTQLQPGDRVLVVEDVLTTGGSTERCIAAVQHAGGIAVPCVFVLVNRSGLSHVGNRPIVSLVTKDLPIWEPDDCLLCDENSEAIRPKGKEAWARLNAPSSEL